jgi:hypothetical protein
VPELGWKDYNAAATYRNGDYAVLLTDLRAATQSLADVRVNDCEGLDPSTGST